MRISDLALAAAIAAGLPGAAFAQTDPAPAAAPAPDPELVRQRQAAANALAEARRLRGEIERRDALLELARTRNAELYRTANEILDRYAGRSTVGHLLGREPYIQKARVDLENRVQDFEDRLRAARFTAETQLPAPPADPAPTTPAPAQPE